MANKTNSISTWNIDTERQHTNTASAATFPSPLILGGPTKRKGNPSSRIHEAYLTFRPMYFAYGHYRLLTFFLRRNIPVTNAWYCFCFRMRVAHLKEGSALYTVIKTQKIPLWSSIGISKKGKKRKCYKHPPEEINFIMRLFIYWVEDNHCAYEKFLKW